MPGKPPGRAQSFKTQEVEYYVWFYFQSADRRSGWLHRRPHYGSETSTVRNIVLGILGGFVGSIVFGLIGLSATGIVGWRSSFPLWVACICIWIGRKLFN